MATIQGDSTQASAMTTTHSGLHSSSPTGISSTTWIFDSGSSHHMTPDVSLLSHCVTPVSPISIAIATGSPMSVVSIGSISSRALSISDVFYVPQLSLSLLSISQLSDSDFDVVFSSSTCVVQDQVIRKQIRTGCRVGDLYILENLHILPSSSSASCTAVSSFYLNQKSSPFFLWHSRLGHLSSERLKL